MKQSFQILGIITLVVGSFMYTEQVSTASKLSDELLIEIKNKQNDYNKEVKEAIIAQNTIIPGINGQKVNIESSYQNMREVGYFNEKLLKYDTVYVKEPLKENKDKYIISGNQSKKQISLMFKVDNNDNINKIISVLDKHNIKATFFIESPFLQNNYNLIINLIQKGHTIGNLSYHEDYTHSDFVWMKTIITNAGNQNNNYCYTTKKAKKVLKNCKLQDSYTIIPTKVITQSPFINVKNNLTKGALISLEVNNELNTELENIVNYVINKGYKIVPLEKELQE